MKDEILDFLEKEFQNWRNIVENDFQTYFVQDTEKDFIIIDHVMDNGRITEAISTSMDRLLLEMEEN